MNYVTPAVGALYHANNSCAFTVWAPEKKKVELVFPEKPGEKFLMKVDERGYWSIVWDEIKPFTRYFFRIDEKDLPDPASRFQPEGVHGHSAIVNPNFSWNDHSWQGLPLKDMIIYELHVGTFTRLGTFAGIVDKLPHLKQLGVNTIELMPVAQFPGSRNWGYDGVFPFAVQDSYGGVAGLKKLVDVAHQLGIAVVLDVVYNHLGPEGNYLHEFGPYFSGRYKTFWGSALNFDDSYCDGVRNFFWQNALMWLDEFHIDGLRLDAVHAIWDSSATHFIEELVRKVKELQATRGCEKILIAEFDLNNPRYINEPAKGGYGMDAQWTDEFHHALHSLATGERGGYYEDFGESKHLAKAIRDGYVYTGEYSAHRKKIFGRLPGDTRYSQFVVFAQNHDQVGNRMLGDRLTHSLSFEGMKLVAATLLLSPQVPMLFMGEEYGERNPFQYFISHTDEKLVEMVREGRRKEFSYFKWEGNIPDPQAEETFDACILSWELNQDGNQRKLFEFYHYLIDFRKKRKAMKGTEKKSVKVFEPVAVKVISFSRTFEQDVIYVVLNFEKTPQKYQLPNRHVAQKKIFDSSEEKWNGPGEYISPDKFNDDEVWLQPESAVIFES
jgi:maltooligosyltrehalose trehalohydrolase